MNSSNARSLAHLKLSIVIATYNRQEKLNRLLQSIVKSSFKSSYEIIVIDDSEIETKIAEENQQALTKILKVVHNPHRVFFTKARNQGWKNSHGEYILFIDDDNVLEESTIDRLTSTLDRTPRIGALMAVVYYEGRRDLVWVYATPFAPGKWRFDLMGRNTRELRRLEVELMPTDALPNGFMVRRSLVDLLGGFDESFLMSSSCDLCQRIQKSGYGTFALTTAKTYHDVTLPMTKGYWAEHASTDPERRYYDVRDWFVLMARLHQNEQLLLPKEFVRSLAFVLASIAGVLLHPAQGRKSIPSIYVSMIRGIADGMKLAATQTIGYYRDSDSYIIQRTPNTILPAS